MGVNFLAVSYMDFTKPGVQFFADMNKNRLFTRNTENYINRLGRDDLNTLGNNSLLDIYMSKGHVVEPHYHQNASELVYCIKGSAVVSLINPFTQEVKEIHITPGQVANLPQGWWHWIIASSDETHLLSIFDAPYPEYILGSDVLKNTPIEVLAHTYCLDANKLQSALAPLEGGTIIGPKDGCISQRQRNEMQPPQQSMPNHPAYERTNYHRPPQTSVQYPNYMQPSPPPNNVAY